MLTVLIFLLLLESLILVGWSVFKSSRMIQFPFLIGVVILGWVIPQIFGLLGNTTLPKSGLEKTVLMVILCLAAVWLGYISNNKPAKLFRSRLNYERLFWCAVIYSFVGIFFQIQVSQIAVENNYIADGNWSGIITIYQFFSKMITVGMVIALILQLHRPNLPMLSILLIDLAFYFNLIIIKGRRAAMLELVLITLLALWFYRRWLPTRSMMFTSLIVGALIVNSIGDYRRTMLSDDGWSWSGAGVTQVLSIDFIGNIKSIIKGEAYSYEIYNAVMTIEAVDRRHDFDYGLSTWNYFVHRFVPGQFVGEDLKQSLMFEYKDSGYLEFRYVSKRGSTKTGFADAFHSFWYFGAIIYFIIGFIMSRLYLAAFRGNITVQVILMCLMSASLHSITHGTYWFFVELTRILIFILPIYIYTRNRDRQSENLISEKQQIENRI